MIKIIRNRIVPGQWINKTLIIILLLSPIAGWSQTARTSYFMDVPERLTLNPALFPSRGYLKLPILGGLQAEYTSNSMSINDFKDLSGDYKEDVLSKLKEHNKIDANVVVDVISFGFYTGDHFWSAHATAHIRGNVDMPKQLLRLTSDLNDISTLTDYSIDDVKLRMAGYAEAGVGYGKKLTDRLTVGARLNVLVGLAQASLDVDKVEIHRRGDVMTIRPVGASMSVSPSLKNQDGVFYLGDLSMDKLAVSSFGMTVSLGANYRLLDNLNLSLAINDLGFMGWSNTTVAEGVEIEKNVDDISDDVLNLLPFDGMEKKSVNQAIYPLLNIGAEYAFFNNKLGLGLLSSTRFGGSYTASELTLSANYRPSRMIGLSASYSMLQSRFSTIGLAFKLGAFFIGTDYLFFNPMKSKSMSAFLGINIPLGKPRS